MNKQTKSFVSGAAILGVIGLICKIIGAFYRIPMTTLIGTQGISYYQTVYPIYVILLSISSAGIPVAISKMMSERIALGDFASAKSVFKIALKLLLLFGTITTVIMLALSYPLSLVYKDVYPNIVYSYLALSPALFFVSVMSAYRGYFQGLQQMAPTAFSQLIEQVGKLGTGLIFAKILLPKGIEWAAAGAIIGVTVAELLSFIFIYILYNANKKRFTLSNSVPCSLPSDKRSITRNLLIFAVPIMIGACANSIAQLADTIIVPVALTSIGKTAKEIQILFGNLSGVVNSLINMPAVLSLALAMSLVPAISASKAKNDTSGISGQASFGFKLSMLIGLPCAVGFYLLAQPIISLLYPKLVTEIVSVSPFVTSLDVASELLRIMAVSVLFLTVVQPMTGILQGLGKTYIPVINLFIGVIVKVIISLALIKIPNININGAAIGTIACYAVAGILDLIFVIKYSKMKLNLLNTLVKPLIATFAMGIVLMLLNPILFERFSNAVATLICIAIGAVVYLVIAAFSIEKQDLEFLPGGRRLEKFYKVKKS